MTFGKISLPFVTLVIIDLRYVMGIFVSNHWLEDVTGVDKLYSSSILTTTELSLAVCIASCSNVTKLLTYNDSSGECSCLNCKTIASTKPGNRLWNRELGGFVYNAQLGWYTRLFLTIKKTHSEAEAFCGCLGGRLLVLDSSEKFDYIAGLMDLQGIPIHVGATDEATEGIFLWSTGTAITENWKRGEPNDGKGAEDCAVLKKPELS
ncbi:C-type lectin domain family 4 member E-like [Ylistrum balloti]|uniref:C-type lectin domain family 4 member E-like n=1 Tax=Ylistrum balloti TaxID=509963 RepID=UPI002905C2D1|nr:C-type lectin domain family 4 member E-like [Ylistrum balloti]